MKKSHFLIFFLLLLSRFSNAQTMKDLFQSSDVKFYWFGIDFSHTQLIGTFNQFALDGETDPSVIKNNYFPGWNGLFITEADKYNVSKMLHNKGIEVDLVPMYKINDKTDISELEAASESHYTSDQIEDFVKDYDFGVKEGIGVFFLAECLNKELEHGIYHIVFLNLADNQVLHTESLTGETGGFGLRNYYAKSFRIAMETIERSCYKKWKIQYSGK